MEGRKKREAGRIKELKNLPNWKTRAHLKQIHSNTRQFQTELKENRYFSYNEVSN